MEKDLRKGSWSAEEDQKLISYINRYGIWNWSQMPKFAGLSRSGKSCRLRWMNYLKPNVKKGKFSKEEDEIILHSHSLLGNRWSTIASKLPGRTDNDVKNYWHAHLKKRASEQNLVFETTKKNDTSSSAPTFEAERVEQIQDSADRMNDNFEFESSHEDESSSSHRITTFEDRQDEFRTCSIGTTDDLQCFWDQLCPVENLELRNNHVGVFSYDILHDSYNDGISSNDFYNNSILPDP